LGKSKIITYVIGSIAFIIPIKLYLTPPTDFDGGPMLAYNFLFFYPLLFLSIILSIIVIHRLKGFKNEFIPKLILAISTLPSLILAIMVLINIVRIANEPEIIDVEIPNNKINIVVNDSLELKLIGFTKRSSINNEEVIEIKKINLVPYINGTYSFKDGGEFISKSEYQDLLYEIKNDSLMFYVSGYEYYYYNKTRIPLPFKVERLENDKLERTNFNKFKWDEYSH